MISYKAVLTATVVAIVTVLATGGVASAHTERYASQATALFTEQGPADYFSGRVTSPQPPCESNRLVRVYRRSPAGDLFQGATRTDANGFWRLYSKNPRHGVYYARVAREFLRITEAHAHVCRSAVSNDVVVPAQP